MCLKFIYFNLCSLFLLFINYTHAYLEYDGWLSFELYHALDPNNLEKFTFRGNVTIPSLTVGLATIKQEPLTPSEKDNLLELAKENGFYRLRALVSYSDGSKVDFLTSSKACALINSDLNDVIWISIDSTGSVLGLIQTIPGNGNCKDLNLRATDLDVFTTDVLIKGMELAPVPDTASFIQKLEREREARERGEVRDNRGFFAKYWMYIVPVALLVLISGATNPEANSAGGGGGRR